MEVTVKQVMARYFGYSQFKPGQEELINKILASRDILGVMPTGGGKSLCYQLPALVLPGVTLVISPLIALMKDQVDDLNNQGIAASLINSSLTANEIQNRLYKTKQGRYKLLYVAPERLDSEQFTSMLTELPVSLIAIDEAHCVSQWGHDFRPSYRHIGQWIDSLPQKPVRAAFTATATPRVRQDIIDLLGLNQPHIVLNSFDRANLHLSVIKGVNRTRYINQFIEAHQGQSGIVYAATRKEVDSLYEELTARGYQVGRYHAGLSNQERNLTQEAFIYDQINVIIATNAFGLGIDKSNVRYVIHHNMPRHLEAYYQEAGRAGRDGEPAETVLLFQAADIQVQKYLIEQSELSPSRKQMEYIKLQQMIEYCHTTHCLRQHILNYFGENDVPDFCGSCINCGEMETRDVTINAQKIFSCIIRMKQPYGSALIAAVLKGSQQKRIRQLGFDQLSTHGIMQECSTAEIVDLINLLAAENYLAISVGQYPVVSLTSRALPVLRGQQDLLLRLPPAPAAAPLESDLFQALRDLRMRIAQEQKVPPYVVFTDRALREMSALKPLSRQDMLGINGVGEIKFEKYGQAFLELIGQFQGEQLVQQEGPEHITGSEPDNQAFGLDQPPKSKTEKVKTPTYLITYEGFRNGKTLDQIAVERGLTLETVQKHLLHAFEQDLDVDWSPFITPQMEQQILDQARRLGTEKLSPLKAALPPDISYFAIRIVLARAGKSG